MKQYQTISEILSTQHVYIKPDEASGLKRHIYFSKNTLSVLALGGWIRYPIQVEQKVYIHPDLEYIHILGPQADQTIKPPLIPRDTLVCKPAHIDLVMKQMKTKGLSYTEEDADYFEGIGRYFSYNPEKNSFQIQEVDTIIGSFNTITTLSPSEFHKRLFEAASLHELREAGFLLPYIPA